MNSQKKQQILSKVIIALLIGIIIVFISMIYDEIINIKQNVTVKTNATVAEKKEPVVDKNLTNKKEEEIKEENKQEVNESIQNTETEFSGEEESNVEETQEKSTDEKVIDTVKKEWGNDDTVTFSIEKKSGSIYRVAVRNSSTTVLQWYEVNIETWKVSEY